MSDADPFNLPNLAQIIDTYTHRILDSGEDPVDVLLDLMGALIAPPLLEHLWCVGGLYGNFGLLSDIVDAYPVDYGANAETIAAREIRDAARDCLALLGGETLLMLHRSDPTLRGVARHAVVVGDCLDASGLQKHGCEVPGRPPVVAAAGFG